MSYKLREVTVPVLPAGHRSIRVLHFSDLHLTPRRKTEIADIKSFADLKPDLVISTGDFMAHKGAVPVVLDALHPLFDIPGLFVFGSNDYYGPRPKTTFMDKERCQRKQMTCQNPFKKEKHTEERRNTIKNPFQAL